MTRTLVWLLAAVIALDLVFVGAVMYRRWARRRYFREKSRCIPSMPGS